MLKHNTKFKQAGRHIQRQTADEIRAIYEGRRAVSRSTLVCLSRSINNVARRRGIAAKAKHEIYLAAVADGAFVEHVESLVREARREHDQSLLVQLPKALARAQADGTPTRESVRLIDALLGYVRLQLSILPTGLDLAAAIYKAATDANDKARRLCAGGYLPHDLDVPVGELHRALYKLTHGEPLADRFPGEAMMRQRAEQALKAWFAGDFEPPAYDTSPEEQAAPSDAPAAVIDLNLYAQSHPRRIVRTLFAEKGGGDE